MQNIHIYPDEDTLTQGLAEWLAGNMALVLKKQERYSFVLSGGHTPKKLYEVLAREYRGQIEWDRIDFFWGDERYVPFDDERNNGRMAYASLLSPLGIPEENIYRIKTGPTPEEAARNYEGVIRKYFQKSSAQAFDFTLLGMGDDGHTLSVFPYSELVGNRSDWVKNTVNRKENLPRITLLPLLVNRSGAIAFMVKGVSKAYALEQVLKGKFDPVNFPAHLISSDKGRVNWFTDEAAAAAILKE